MTYPLERIVSRDRPRQLPARTRATAGTPSNCLGASSGRARPAGNSVCEQLRIGPAGIHGFAGRVRRARLVRGGRDQLRPVVPEPKHNRGKPHQRAIARTPRIGRAGDRVTGLQIPVKRLAGRRPNVNTPPCAGIVAGVPPSDEAVHYVPTVENLGRRQTVGERQRHGRIVGPGPRCQREGTAAHHVDQPRLRIAGGKLERGANGITHRQTKEGAERPVPDALHRPGWVGRRSRPTPHHMGFLCRCFNGTGPAGIAHPTDRLVRAHAQLDQQSGGDGPGTTQTSPAMNHHVEARSESVTDGPARAPQAVSKTGPGGDPSGIGRGHHSMCRCSTALPRPRTDKRSNS